jgi:DNA-directed RNA polymerase specialized sigma24 family protein
MSIQKMKPSLEEVLEYGRPLLKKFIADFALDLPPEQKIEIEQEGFLRLVEAYNGIDPDAGWKSYVYMHTRGAVLDYLKAGHGFEESRWSIAKAEDSDSRFTTKIRERLELTNYEDDDVDIDSILGQNGVFKELDIDELEIKWDLLARMASTDENLHAFAKYLKGQTIEQLAPTFDIKRARAGQMIQAFIDRFDDPNCACDPWFLQTCYALDLCDLIGVPKKDYGVGWTLEPVDLDREDEQKANPQMTFSLGDCG